MKKSSILLHILTVTLVMVSFVSCIKESGYDLECFVINSSGHTLELMKYGSGPIDTVAMDIGEEYMFYAQGHFGEYENLIAPFRNAEDSIVIQFDDGKKIVYTLLPYCQMDSVYNTTKNIYLLRFYQLTEIETGVEGLSYYKERFYITPDDYQLAE